MHRTLIIRREYLHFIPKYARYEKRHKNLAAHVSPAFRVEDGDQVTVGQCRPLSKTVRYLGTSGFLEREMLTGGLTGPIQRSPCASPNWQGCQDLQQILGDFLMGFFRAWGLWGYEQRAVDIWASMRAGKGKIPISCSAYLNGSTKL